MLIRVEYSHRSYDMVQTCYIEALIAEKRIRRFRREDGWVEIGRDRLRSSGDRRYGGPERRSPVNHRPLNAPIRIGGRIYRPLFGGGYLLP